MLGARSGCCKFDDWRLDCGEELFRTKRCLVLPMAEVCPSCCPRCLNESSIDLHGGRTLRRRAIWWARPAGIPCLVRFIVKMAGVQDRAAEIQLTVYRYPVRRMRRKISLSSALNWAWCKLGCMHWRRRHRHDMRCCFVDVYDIVKPAFAVSMSRERHRHAHHFVPVAIPGYRRRTCFDRTDHHASVLVDASRGDDVGVH